MQAKKSAVRQAVAHIYANKNRHAVILGAAQQLLESGDGACYYDAMNLISGAVDDMRILIEPDFTKEEFTQELLAA